MSDIHRLRSVAIGVAPSAARNGLPTQEMLSHILPEMGGVLEVGSSIENMPSVSPKRFSARAATRWMLCLALSMGRRMSNHRKKPPLSNASNAVGMDKITGEIKPKMPLGKSSSAVELGRKGGNARAQSMSSERRVEIARQAAASRWNYKLHEKPSQEIIRVSDGKRRTKYTSPQPGCSKFRRHEPEVEGELAELALFEEMERAAELLQSQEDFGRSGIGHAVHACYSFLHVRGLSGQALKPLIDLIRALKSVDKRILPELFDPKVKPAQIPARKWSRSPAALETKVLAAACMDALMNNDVSKSTAARRVADHASQWPRVSEGMIAANTVTNWRDELLQAPKRSDLRQSFVRLSLMFSQGARSKAHLKEALRLGPVFSGGIRKHA
jgi:hypothetical protein